MKISATGKMLYCAWCSWRYFRRADFARAAAAAIPAYSKGMTVPWLAQTYYRLGMHATLANFPLHAAQKRYLVPVVVALAACGQYARVRHMFEQLRREHVPSQLRVALAAALAPFMPDAALRLLIPVCNQAPSALYSALLLRTGYVQRACHVLDAALRAGQARHYPELHLYRSMAMPGLARQQLERLNCFLTAYGVPPLALLHPDTPPGPYNVWMPEQAVRINGPLVSVLMTTYNSGMRALAAIESLLQQTWRNLEILVVDDASEDGTGDLVAACARRDARVRLLRLPINGGTYLAKNMALLHARGEFVTCHDSDDWAHPLKIERQMRPLLQNANLVATTSHWLRMQDDGMYHARAVHPLLRLNPASPLFRRVPVLQRMGPWDCVRTGADSEFYARLRLVFGNGAVQRIVQPLTLGAHRAGSLMTDTATGYAENSISPQRLAYWEAWSHWHLACLRRGELPCLPQDLPSLIQNRPKSSLKCNTRHKGRYAHASRRSLLSIQKEISLRRPRAPSCRTPHQRDIRAARTQRKLTFIPLVCSLIFQEKHAVIDTAQCYENFSSLAAGGVALQIRHHPVRFPRRSRLCRRQNKCWNCCRIFMI